MGDSDLKASSFIRSAIRNVSSFLLDRPAFFLLGLIYKLFFNVASANLFANETVLKFYSRCQLILGVFTMFQLALSILKGIVNPDEFFDKNKGIENVIKRIVISLILLTLITPISIPGASNEYEKQINNNGILFGTLYSLQHRILSNNTLGRLILGTTDSSTTFVSDDSNDEDSELSKSSRIFTSTILKGFYRINLIPESQRKHEDGKDDAIFNENRVCQDIDDEVLAAYTRTDADPGDIIDLVDATCDLNGDSTIWDSIVNFFKSFTGDEYYLLAYTPFLGAVVAIVFSIILIGFTVDVAVRAVKLAVLRLLAPVPIISYMNPNGSKDGAFNAWVKNLTATYLDLFIRLALVYLIIFLIQDMIVNGIQINSLSGSVGVFSLIFIWIGLFLFAKQAPQFIKEIFGINKDFKLFGGIGEMLGGLSFAGGVAATGLGAIGSAAAGVRAAREENTALHPNNHLLNFGRSAASAIGGFAGGLYAGGKAAFGKDGSVKNVLAAQNQRNAMRAAHSTLPGRLQSSAYGMFTGQSLSTRGNNIVKGAEDFVKKQSAWKSAVEDEARTNGRAITFTTSAGSFSARYEELERAVASAHDGKVTIAGHDYDSNIFTKSFMDDALKDQVRDFQSGGTKTGGNSYSTLISSGQKLYRKREDVIKTLSDVDLSGASSPYNVDGVDTYGANIGEANRIISEQENNMEQIMRRANDQQSKK